MAPLHLLKLPAEIRDKMYRHVLCFDGVKPAIRFDWNPWQPSLTERSGLRMQVNVITPVRNGEYPGDLSHLLASDALSLLRTCHQVYKEAKFIFWAENAFIFLNGESMSTFMHQIRPECMQLIRILGIESVVDAVSLKIANGGNEDRVWPAHDSRPPVLQPLQLDGWEVKVDNYLCKRLHWVPNPSELSYVQIRGLKIECMITYFWQTRPESSKVEPLNHS